MIIQKALKETGKVKLPMWLDGAYVYLNDGILYLKGVDGYNKPYSSSALLRGDWIPCHEVKEIRPENTGELWEYDAKYLKIFIFNNPALGLSSIDETGQEASIPKHMIHGKNGFTRIEPPVDDESIKRWELQVEWLEGKTKDGKHTIAYPVGGPKAGEETIKLDQQVLNKTKMKMILEIPKDKP